MTMLASQLGTCRIQPLAAVIAGLNQCGAEAGNADAAGVPRQLRAGMGGAAVGGKGGGPWIASRAVGDCIFTRS